ncbi:MAG TPA: ADOP family duplicated permease, partial [Vicinamibacterales bacterium]|nr:ADOP family duplicated permease [Vicinamibacterales bacterium]
MGVLWQDLRYAVRMLRRQPGFAAVAVLSLALGIGANTAIFSIINSIFFASIPVRDPARLVHLFTTDQRNPGLLGISRLNAVDYGEQVPALAGVARFTFVPITLGAQGDTKPEIVAGQMVSGNYFSVLGIEPELGRFFLPEENQVPDRNPVAVLGDALWRTRFGADPHVVGRTTLIDGNPFTIVGIAPRVFTGPETGIRVDVWVPMMMHHLVMPLDALAFDHRRALMFQAIARLAPGAGVAQAQVQANAVARRLEQAYPQPNKGRGVRLVTMAEGAIPGARSLFTMIATILMTIVGFVLLIACANVANLLLARAAARRREIAVRVSLGAGRWRLGRQLLTESLLLALVAGALGLLVGVWARDLIWGLRPPSSGPFTLQLGPAVDGRVLLFTLAVAVTAGVLFGLAPAIQATRPDLVVDLKDRSSQISDMHGRFSLRKALVVLQVALSFAALLGAGLFVRSLQNAEKIDPGFRTSDVAVLDVDLQAAGYDEARGQVFFRQMLARVQALPGVREASLSTVLPMRGGGLGRTVIPLGEAAPPGGGGVLSLTSSITSAYFETMGITLLRGRLFQPTDVAGAPDVAIVNEAMAKRFFPTRDPLGQRFQFYGQDAPIGIVGLVADNKFFSVGEPPRPCVYVPLDQGDMGPAWLEVRTSGDTSAVL